MNYSILSRSYDLRGIYGVDIDDEFFYRLGYAFATWSGARRIALGYDARLSSPVLKTAFARGANTAGATIIDIGLCSSDMLSFATCHYEDIEIGAMITASHNPKEYNGMKALRHSGEAINLKQVGPAIVNIMEEMNNAHSAGEQGITEHRDVTDDWIDHILSFSGNKDFSGMRIVCDAGNGAAGAFLEAFSRKAKFEMISLFLDPDGNFPNHHPSPIEAKNREHARQKLLEEKADMALIFDGDADRCVILDEHGEMIISGIISVIIAHSLLQKHPGKKICGNAVISHTLEDYVKGIGGKYVKEMVGHVYIKNRMSEDPDIIFAGEHSSHYYLRDNWNQDSGIVAAMIFMDLLKDSGLSASKFTASYKKYITLEETNFEVPNPKEAIKILGEKYTQEDHDFFDGITVRYADGSWWNFRPSSNEPLLRLNMEAKTQERFDELYHEIIEIIHGFTK